MNDLYELRRMLNKAAKSKSAPARTTPFTERDQRWDIGKAFKLYLVIFRIDSRPNLLLFSFNFHAIIRSSSPNAFRLVH
jgi:hypothetical protein